MLKLGALNTNIFFHKSYGAFTLSKLLNSSASCFEVSEIRKLGLKRTEYFTLISSPPEVFLRKGALEICSKFAGDHPCQSVISMKLRNRNKIEFWYMCLPANLPHIFRAPFLKNTSEETLL